jgi:formate C-acetyltransferase
MLATEGYRRFEHEARPLCRAKTFGHILESMTLDLQTNPVFAGNMSSQPRAWMLLPEYGFHVPEQAPVENPEFRDFLNGKVPAELLDFWAGRSFGGGAGIGHLAVNLEKVLSVGLEGIIAEAEDHQDEDSTRRVYREAMISSCEAVIRWANRYAQAAHEEAAETEEPGARKALLRVAEACRHVPQKPARNLFEALQAIVLVHLAIHIEGHGYSVSPGLLDRLLLPYFEDRGETTELLAAFMLKLSANSLWGSHSKTQAITLGGLDASGRDWCSPLTLRFLEAEDMIRMPDPHLFLRWHEKIDRRVKECTLDLLAAGLSMPSLIGDEQTVSGFIQAGIPEKDAWNYCVIGCNELGIPGKLADSATGPLLNDAAILNETLLPVADPDSISGMEELMRLIEKRMKEYLTPRLRGQMKARARAAEVVPTPFTSALMDGCVKRGQDMHAGMEYSRPALYERGFTNVVNALAAIEHVVFETKSLTLSQLVEALKGNFQDQSIRAMLLRAPKWGSDDDRADRWASAWLEMRDRITRRGEDELGGPRRYLYNDDAIF